MSLKKRLRAGLFCLALGLGSLAGVPMTPEEIEELMHTMHRPTVAQQLPEDWEKGEDVLERSAALRK